MIVFCRIISFFSDATVATFELGFAAVVPQVNHHSVVAFDSLFATIENALERRYLVVCEMSSCINILESPIAESFLTLKLASFQVVIYSFGNVCTFKLLSARWARRIKSKPAFNTLFANKFFTLAALLSFPNDIFTNQTNAVV